MNRYLAIALAWIFCSVFITVLIVIMERRKSKKNPLPRRTPASPSSSTPKPAAKPAFKSSPEAKLKAEQKEEIDTMLSYLSQRLGPPLPEFVPSRFDYYYDTLTYEAHNAGAVSSMMDEVLRHFQVDSSKVQCKTLYLSPEQKQSNSQQGASIRGTFNSPVAGYGVIQIAIEPKDSSYDTVIAIILHECAHYVSRLRHTELKDKDKNERLTDLTAIWLGGGTRMERGYFPRSQLKIGYLSREECLYAISEVKKRRQDAQREAETLRQKFKAEVTMQESVLHYADKFARMRVICSHSSQLCLDSLREKSYAISQQLSVVCDTMRQTLSSASPYIPCAQLLEESQRLRETLTHTLTAMERYEPLSYAHLRLDDAQFSQLFYLSHAIETKPPISQFQMLEFYTSHTHAPADLASEEASALFHLLQQKDTPEAHYYLGCCYHKGVFVSQDMLKASSHWTTAANSGFEKAMEALQQL